MFTMWAFAAIFLLFNCGFTPKKQEREVREAIEKLKELGVDEK